MNAGLGKESPIRLKLSVDNYEGLIDRHGQWVRWVRADKCPCSVSGRTNPNCPICHGDGIRHSHTTHTIETRQAQIIRDGMLEIPAGFSAVSIEAIYDYMGISYVPGEIFGRYVRFAGDRTPDRHEALEVVFKNSLSLSRVNVQCALIGAREIRITGIPPLIPSGRVWSDILSISRVENIDTGTRYTPVSWSGTIVTVEEMLEAGRFICDCETIGPYRFALLSQFARKEDQQFLSDVGGDASLIFPGQYPIAEGDVVTTFGGVQVGKRIIARSVTGDFDLIPEYFISRVLKIESGEREYTDFALWDNNHVKWGTERPAAGVKLSVTYEYHPTYRVLKEFPVLRSSENSMLPRRVAVKLLSGYQQRDGIQF